MAEFMYEPGYDWNKDLEMSRAGLLNAPDVNRYGNVLAGGLGNYGSLNGVGLSKAAYDAVSGTGVEGLTKNASGYLGDSMDWLGKQPLSQLSGLAGLGLSAYNQLFGNQNDLFKEQLGLLKDKRAENKRLIADDKKFKTNVGTGFNNAFSGLASSGVTV